VACFVEGYSVQFIRQKSRDRIGNAFHTRINAAKQDIENN